MSAKRLLQRFLLPLTVAGLALPLLVHGQAPHITQPPQSQSAVAGAVVNFTVAATGKTPLSYYWSFNGSTLTDGGRISGARAATLTLSNIVGGDAGTYRVMVSNRQGTAISGPATLTVFVPPTITQSPQSQPVVLGSNATFSVTATGTAPLRYQWSFNGARLDAATNTSLSLTNAGLANAGSYTVVVTNLYGSATSAAAVLELILPPTISDLPDQRTFPGHPTRAVSFIVGDAQAPAVSLALTGSSSDTGLVPNENIVFGGVGSDRTVTVTPSGGVNGTVEITITVRNPYGAETSKSFQVSVAGFSEVNAGLTPLTLAAAAWGDYSNDGRLDLLLSGIDTNGTRVTKLYRNEGNGLFTDTGAALDALYAGMVAWGDYDNDGRLDILANGVVSGNQGLAQIYRNETNGTFFKVTSFTGWTCEANATYRQGMVAWGDYDNDGQLEPLFAGVGGVLMDYNPGTKGFEFADAPFPLIWQGATIWGDFDNDDQLDLFASGWNGASTIYGGGASTTISLPPALGAGSGATGDFDNDGYLDLAVQDRFWTAICRSAGGTNFNVIVSGLPGGEGCINSVAWGDYDNDGYLDLLVAAPGGTYIYRNQGDGTFNDSSLVLPGCCQGMAVWGDYDNDGRLDILLIGQSESGYIAKIYHNDGAMPDTPPSPPSGLNGSVAGRSAVLNWAAATDAEQAGGLSYNVRMGTGPGGSDVVGPMADAATGFRRVPAPGNAGLRLNYRIGNLRAGTYYWSVQAIDNTFAGSGFAPERSFTLSAPVITNSPASQMVLVGEAALFSVGATGTAPLAYQWYFNGNPVAGATMSDLYINNVQSNRVGSYVAVVTNALGAATSGIAVLTVPVPPAITQQPQDQIGGAGSNITFAATVTGTAPLFFQWFLDGVLLANGGRISGATTTALGIANLQTSDAGGYQLVVTNLVGVATSSAARLAVFVPPTILRQPVNQTVVVSNSAGFAVEAAGTSLSYQWYRDAVRLADTARITGSTTPNLALADVQPSDAGTYAVVVSNAVGSAASAGAELTVLAPPMVTQQPQNQTVLFGADATFTVAAVGTAPVSYRWQKDGLDLVDDGRVHGTGTGTLRISGVLGGDSGAYRVVVSNAYGVATSQPAVLTVLVPPSIVTQPANQAVLASSNATLSVTAAGSEPLSYQWFFNGAPLADGTRMTGSTSPSLTMSNVQVADGGSYAVTITNGAGSITSTAAVLTVLEPPVIVAQPTGCSVALGLPATFRVSASGTAPLSYRWQLNGLDMPGATNSSLMIAAVGMADLGLYRVIVSNTAAVAVSAPAVLTQGSVAAWARNDYQQTVVPVGVGEVVAVAAGVTHSLALRSDGTVAPWGGNAYGQATVPADLSNVVAIAAGANDSLALRSDGIVVAWGNTSGGATSVPVSLSNAAAIAAGTTHSVALRADGIVVSWGTFSSGKAPVAAPAGLRQVTAIAANDSFTMALRADGAVVAWGDNTYGQTNVPAGLTNAVAIAAGGGHSLALRADGTVIAWGRNTYGQTNVPPTVTNAIAIAAGAYHSLALRADGTAVAWGYNNYTQTNTPAVLSNLVGIGCGDSHNLGIVSDGRPLLVRQPAGGTFFTGRPLALQAQAVGAAPLRYQWQHEGVDIPGATNATLFLASLASSDEGSYQVFATNALGTASSLPAPIRVLDGVAPFVLSPLPASQTNNLSSRVALGLSIGGSGPLQYQWRYNGQAISGATNEELVFDPAVTTNTGQYSLAVSNAFGSFITAPDYLTVVQVRVWGYYAYDAPASASNGVAVATSANLYMVLRPDGKVVVWGPQIYNPGPPAWVSNVVAIAAGASQFVVLRSDGTVASWGTPEVGVTNVPPGLNSVVAVAAGYAHTLALRADGSVVGWGNNTYGQTTIPTNATGVVAIAAGYYHSLALRADGSIVGWGLNPYGQAGPPPGTGNTNFVAVAAGYYHNLALRADGTVIAWGLNRSGQAPVPAGLSNVVAVAAGASHSVALRADGTVVAWGIYSQSPAVAPSDLANVVQIAGGGDHSMVLFGTRAPHVTVQPFSRTVYRGTNTTFVAKIVGPQPVRYQWQFDGAAIPGATNESLSLTGVQLSQSGAYQLVATNAYGSVSVTAKLMVTIPLAEALDTTNLMWGSTGSAPWYGQADTTFDGVAAARSGGIGNSQESVLEGSVIGPGRIAWWWKVSSEQDFDTLEFRVGGVTQAVISGEVGWEQRSFLVPSGTQRLQWRYAKDSTFTDGQDAAWVDQVVFVPDPPVLTHEPSSVTVGVGATVYWYVAATGAPPFSYQWLKDGNSLAGATGASLLLTNATRRTAGVYNVRVSNGGGGSMSSNAVLKVLVPQRLGQPLMQTDGSLVLTSGDADGGLLTAADLANFEAQVSTDLVNWASVPGALILTNGGLQLQDSDSVNHRYRFYRILER